MSSGFCSENDCSPYWTRTFCFHKGWSVVMSTTFEKAGVIWISNNSFRWFRCRDSIKENWGEFSRILFASSTRKSLRCGCLLDSEQRHLKAEEETTATDKRKRADIRSWFLTWNKHQMMLGCGKHFFILIYQLIANKEDVPNGNIDTRQFSLLVRFQFWRCKLNLLNIDIY